MRGGRTLTTQPHRIPEPADDASGRMHAYLRGCRDYSRPSRSAAFADFSYGTSGVVEFGACLIAGQIVRRIVWTKEYSHRLTRHSLRTCKLQQALEKPYH